MNRRVTTRAIIYKDGKLFAVRQKRADGAINKYWCMMGGGVDVGEPLLEAIQREVQEEVGIKPVVDKLLYIQQFAEEYHGTPTEFLEFFFLISNVKDFDNIDLSKTTHGSAEISEYDFVDPAHVTLLPKFLTQTDIARDTQSGETKLFNNLTG